MPGADDDTGQALSAPPPTTNIRNGAQAQRDGLRIAATRNTAKSQLCATARQKVKETCGSLEKDLRQAQIDNTKEQNRQVSALPAGPTRPSQAADINRRYGETDRDLFLQRQELTKFRESAETALDDNARCYGDIAQRDTFDAERAQEVLASANSDGPPPAEVKPTAVAALDKHGPEKETDGIIAGVSGQAQSEGQNAVARTTVGAVFGEGSVAAATTRFVAGASTGVLGLGSAGLGIFLGSTTSAGNSCDMLYKDALSADASGCGVATRRTIQSLGAP